MKKIWKNISLLLLAVLLATGGMTLNVNAEEVSGSQTIPSEHLLSRVEDEAYLLTDGERKELTEKLDEISERQQFDVVVVTVNSLDGKSPMEYADDFYDYNGYGMGAGKDGVLLLISMEDRDWYMSTCGFGITAITDAGRDYISKKFLSDLSDGNYFTAFETYADLCDEFVTQAKTGDAYDGDHMPKAPFPLVMNLLIALAAGFIIALIIVECMRRSMKSVRAKSAAADYVRPGSLVVTGKYDRYLYAHTSRTQRSTSSGGAGGSSTHVSSSGMTHGGGGGKF